MNYNEYELIKKYNYTDYCNYLLEKYGAVDGDYFTPTFSQNMTIKRANEGLYIHHIDEDKVANLSNCDVARANSFDYQRAERLVYADLFEHILLHILIGEQNKGLGFGGAEVMFSYANDKIWEDGDVLDILKERCRNSINAYETLLIHNQTVFYELIDTLDKHGFAFLDLGPGLGKTTTALACARKYGVKALVLGPNTTITKGWAGEEDVEPYTYAWFMNNYTSIDYSKYGILICDEAHHLNGKRWREGVEYVKQNKLLKIVGLTGTPNKACRDFFEDKECKGFSVLDGIEREIIHDFSYVGAIYDTSDIKEKYADISDKTLLGELDLALNNTPTVKTIITKHMPNNKRKGIIFVSNISAMDEAEEIMRDIYPNAEYRRMHSLMPFVEVEENREWFQNTDEGYLLAVNMITEGAHYKGVNTIIMFRRTQSSLVFNQQLGRIITLARDEDPHAIVFDLVNNAENLDTEKSFSASLKCVYQQRKEYGGKQKSEQVIVEDYAEAISDVLGRIAEIGQKRAVICIETQVVYSGINEAGRITGIQPRNISGACRGTRITAGKYHWAYVDDVDTITKLANYVGCGPAKKIAPGKYKAVLCIETGEVFESCKAAEEAKGIGRGKVSCVCRGGQKTTGGYHWCFLEDKDNYIMPSLKKQNPNYKKVRCVETNEVFETSGNAGRRYSISYKCINAACHSGGTSAGYHWEFVKEGGEE